MSLLLRSMGKQVDANDYLPFNQNTARLFLTLNKTDLPSLKEAEEEIRTLLDGELHQEPLVASIFSGIYFTDDENEQIDRFCQNLGSLIETRRSLYLYAIGQALLMKRPFGLFHRRNLHLRLASVERSFGNKATWDTSILTHALTAINDLKKVQWEGPNGTAYNVNVSTDLELLPTDYDLIYLDPPYIAPSGGVDYSDFYHFLNGLVDYSAFAGADQTRRHAPILNLTSGWSRADQAERELQSYIDRWPHSTIVLSYRSDGSPAPERLLELLSPNGRSAELLSQKFQYALSDRKNESEILILSFPAI